MGQTCFMAMQVALALLLSRGSAVCDKVNALIAVVEEKLGACINERIASAVGQICGQAFEEVTRQCDMFFPKFKEVLCKLEQAMELMGKAEALAQGASKFRSMMPKW